MSPLKDWTILIVEDELDGQMVVAGMLNYFSVRVDAVGSAEEALALLGKKRYTAIVIDLALPGMDGLSLIRRIRENPATASVPCCAMTAYHTSTVKQEAIDCGFDAFFAKPLDDTLFIRELDRVI